MAASARNREKKKEESHSRTYIQQMARLWKACGDEFAVRRK
jgi:hypothetical protein